MFPQGATAEGVKRAKVESWERSVGTLGGGKALGSLVVRKKPAGAVGKPSTATTTSPVVAVAPVSQTCEFFPPTFVPGVLETQQFAACSPTQQMFACDLKKTRSHCVFCCSRFKVIDG